MIDIMIEIQEIAIEEALVISEGKAKKMWNKIALNIIIEKEAGHT
jgi:hypothetical protein